MTSSEFIKVRLGDIADIQTGPFGSQLHKRDYKEKGTPIITVEHLGQNRIIHKNLPFVSDEDKERLKKFIIKEGDIVFSRVGSVDRRAFVCKKEDGWLFSGRCLRVRVFDNNINPLYLSYYFGLENFKEYIRRIAVGATMPSLNTKIMSDIEVKFPAKDVQDYIAVILSSLDDKIELNNRINKTLEEIAQAIFKHWFVDFEFPDENDQPYKSSGGEMEDSELGPIPKGWTVDTLGELIDICSGKRPKSRQATKSSTHPYPLIGARTIMGYVDEYLYNKPIIVTGRVGTHGVVRRYSGETWPSDNTLVVESKYFHSIYQWMSGLDYSSLNRGSTQPLITQTDIKNQCIIRPTESFLVKYEHLATISIMQ